MRIFLNKTASIWLIVLMILWGGISPVRADRVELSFQGLDLLADLVLAAGKSIKRDGVIMLLHDGAAHKDDQQTGDLRTALVSAGFNVLAINLSLGLDGRTGPIDCAVEQDHLYQEALPEIHAWVKWLHTRKVSNITLAGLGLGANQMALYASKTTQKSVRRVILLAPEPGAKPLVQKKYLKQYGKALADVVFEAQAQIAARQAGALLENTGFLNCQKARVSARSFVSYSYENTMMNIVPLLPVIKKPTLVITGDLGERSEHLLVAMQQIEARQTLKLDVIEGSEGGFESEALTLIADRIKLFETQMRGQ